MTLRQLLNRLGKIYPKRLSEFYDHPGYQTGPRDLNQEIKKVFLCLDFTGACLPEATAYQPDIIITHHPFFFGKPKQIRLQDPLKATLEEKMLKELHCPLYSFHTDFDKAELGMNDVILNALGYNRDHVCEDGCMRVASLPREMTTVEVCQQLCDFFGFDYLPYLDHGKKNKKIAFVAGGGGNMWYLANKERVDLYISGDSAHHSRVDMRRYGLNYIELPHECEEKGFLLGMGDMLLTLDPQLDLKRFSFEKYYSLYTR